MHPLPMQGLLPAANSMQGSCASVNKAPRAEDKDEAASLLSIPATLLEQITKLTFETSGAMSAMGNGRPLLSTSRSCRDAVLGSAHTISFYPQGPAPDPFLVSPTDTVPWAGMLNRACTQGSQRRAIYLQLTPQPHLLPRLLPTTAAALTWDKVHSLKVRPSRHH
jgi:hypothetical protein